MTTVTNNTQLIRISTGEYPLYLSQVRRTHPSVGIAQTPTEADMGELGYAVVHTVERPIADVVEQGEPIELEGRYEQSWTVREFNEQEIAQRLQQRKDERVAQLMQERDAKLTVGAEHIFNDESVQHIQLRDGDRANLAGLRNKAEELIKDGIEDPVMFFITYENNLVYMTPSEMRELTNVAFEGYTTIMGQTYLIKEQIRAATTLEELDEIAFE